MIKNINQSHHIIIIFFLHKHIIISCTVSMTSTVTFMRHYLSTGRNKEKGDDGVKSTGAYVEEAAETKKKLLMMTSARARLAVFYLIVNRTSSLRLDSLLLFFLIVYTTTTNIFLFFVFSYLIIS